MITFHSKLTCDICGKVEESDISFSMWSPAGSPLALTPILPVPWSLQLYNGSKIRVVCSRECKEK